MYRHNKKSLINRRLLVNGVGFGAAMGALGLLGGTKRLRRRKSIPKSAKG